MATSQSFRLSTLTYKRHIAAQTHSPIRPDTDVTTLTNGDEIFPSMLGAIKAARTSISFLTYVYWQGDIASQFAEALAERARAGVQVSVLLDAFGSSKIDNELVGRMQREGVTMLWFRPLRWYTLHKFNNRTHRKILVVDSKVGFIGGVGIAEEWTGHAQDAHHWRDTHFKITGTAVKDLMMSFNENWYEAGGKKIAYHPVPQRKAGTIAVQITSSKGGKKHTESQTLFSTSIRQAKKQIRITTAYFAPSSQFRKELIRASRAGVSVTILTNGPHTNHSIVRHAGHRHYQTLLDAGVTIYEYQTTVLHAKIMTIDAQWATVGSINFDDRSFILNDEISLSLTDHAVIRKLDRQFMTDLAQAKHINRRTWLQRSDITKIIEILSDGLRKQL